MRSVVLLLLIVAISWAATHSFSIREGLAQITRPTSSNLSYVALLF